MNKANRSKILIVDDKDAIRHPICRVLKPLNYIDIVHANSGDEAVKALLKHSVAVILLNINMTNMGGHETARVIASDSSNKNTPIVMVTVEHGSAEDILRAYDAGAVDHISIPIEPRILINKVRQFVTLDQSLKESARIIEHRDRILNAAAEGVIEVGANGIIQYCNEKACALLKSDTISIVGSTFDTWFSQTNRETNLSTNITEVNQGSYQPLYDQAKQRGFHQERNIIINQHHGEGMSVEMNCATATDDSSSSMTLLFQDISIRLNMESHLLKLANFDSLTSLANRTYFHASLSTAMKRQSLLKTTLAVLFLDLDHFKYINDNHGHDAGDKLLQLAGDRITSCLREGDLVARMGGDEFGIILYDIDGPQDVTPIVDEILAIIAEPVNLIDTQLYTSVSIGITVYDNENSTMEELLKAADTAMYEAKAEGRNNYKYFSQNMQEKTTLKHRVQVLLHQAVPNNELSVVYQPKVSLVSKRMIGCEALLRWHPTSSDESETLCSPAVFIPIAEESGQINAIGEWVLKAVLQQTKHWITLPAFEGMTVSINVSTRQLKQPTFFSQVKALLEEYSIPPATIEFEVTETGMLDDLDQVIEALQQLHSLGAIISIDDFGTGNSSLDHLRKLPFDILKIDRSFIKDIGVDRKDEEIIRVIMAMAKTMGLEVIAEGAETAEQLQFLDNIQCELVQGYFFSKPLSSDQLTQMLKNSDPAFATQFHEYEDYISHAHTKTREQFPAINTTLIKKQILLCEDDLDSAYIVQNLLTDADYEVDIALSAKEARKLITYKSYSAMLLDLDLGDDNGLNLLRELRNNDATIDLPTIVLSGTADWACKNSDCEALNVLNWIQKPINETKLLSSLNQALMVNHAETLLKVLHVEDEPGIAELVDNILEDIAIITKTNNLKTAKKALKEHDFDLLLLDVTLPDGCGLDLLNNTSVLGKPIPVFVLTGNQYNIKNDYLARITRVYNKEAIAYLHLRNEIKTIYDSRQEHFKDDNLATSEQPAQ